MLTKNANGENHEMRRKEDVCEGESVCMCVRVCVCVCAHIEAVSCYHNNKKTLTTQRVVQVVWSGNLKLKKKI